MADYVLLDGPPAPPPVDPPPPPPPAPGELPAFRRPASVREPVRLVELRAHKCGLVYGEGACTAALGVTGEAKCYNTRATCQAPLAFAAVPAVVRFAEPRENLPLAWAAVPSVRSISTKAQRLNIAGLSTKSSALGLRGTLTVGLTDHADTDTLGDPYAAERGHGLLAPGSYWGRWLARNDDWSDIEVWLLEGDIDDDPAEMTRRRFFLEEIAGPDASGRVTLKARDILSRADDKKVEAPATSRGELASPVSAAATSLVVTYAGEDEYRLRGGPGGVVRIGRELIRFVALEETGDPDTRRLIGLSRGLYGTTAAAHDDGEAVQACLEFANEAPADILAELLVDWAGVPLEWLDLEQWQVEAGRWLLPYAALSAVISKPTGVASLIRELAESCMFSLWVDDAAEKIRLRAVRPPEEGVIELTDDGHILAGTVAREYDMEEQASSAEVYYQLRDFTANATDPRDFARVLARPGTQYGQPRPRKIYSRWLQTQVQASQTARTLINHAAARPLFVTLQVGLKDAGLQPGAVVRLSSRVVQDEAGRASRRLFQVVEIDRGETAARVTLRALGAFPPVSLWGGVATPDYADADDETRRLFGYWSDDDGLIDGQPSPYVWS